jgi:glucose/arabinose dehydrogenase
VRRLLGVFSVLALALPGTAAAVSLQAVPGGGGFDHPVHVNAPRNAPAGTLYVVEQSGYVRKLEGGTKSLFLDIHTRVSNGSEQGLLSIAFDPDFATNHFFYVNYTDVNGDTRVVRYRTDPTMSHADLSTARRILLVRQPYSNHNGGLGAFGPNGRLYVGMGDGGSACDPQNRAQNLGTRLGKLISLNPRNIAGGWRIDAYGARNPWRFSFDRALGRLYIGDVGQDTWEEIDTISRWALGGTPENLGWNPFEGPYRSPCATTGLNTRGPLIRPISAYSHSYGCSVTGGFVYRGSLMSSLRGWYFFGDYCSGRIWRLLFRSGHLVSGKRLVLDSGLNITSFGEDSHGELYVADHNGAIYQLVP